MKRYLSTDFEGTSGIVAWEQIIARSLSYVRHGGNADASFGRSLAISIEQHSIATGARVLLLLIKRY